MNWFPVGFPAENPVAFRWVWEWREAGSDALKQNLNPFQGRWLIVQLNLFA